jgi:fibro-slime domain-containing protein
MQYPLLGRGRPALNFRPDAPRGVGWVGLAALALAAGCGAGGDDAAGVVTRPEQAAGGSPTIGGGGTGTGIPTVSGICTAPSCDLSGGGPVSTPPGCGDGVLTADEACDDGNRVGGDGCGEQCLATEPGFSCASPGQACQQIARCGDGLVAATEQCDDSNPTSGDGCSSRCRVELGKKCDGQPSVCTDAICGNGIKEGAEACDDGNTAPFDGCSPICLKEPNCAGLSCVSDCGDGLLIDEACDDGNLIDGDGCSSACQVETGFNCVAQAACEEIGGQCVLRVPAVFRDFSDSHTDFGGNACTVLATGAVADTLDANGRPTLGAPAAAAAACLSTQDSFADWYTSNANSVTLIGEVLLFDNGAGGYVNRFGAQGEPFEAVDPDTERGGGASLAACANACLNEAQNGNAPYDGPLRCNDLCRPITDDIQQLTVGQLNQLNNQLTQAQNAAVPDADAITDLEAQIAVVEAQIAGLQADAATCQTDCQTELDARVATCAPTCKPCSFNPAQFCIGGEVLSFDGNPVFFPVDSITGPTNDLFPAKIPEQYGYNGFPNESVVYPGAPDHNFYFTSEVQYWFKYDANTQARLDFLGDDDVWVFLNGKLAVDLGGIHVPSRGSVTIDAPAGTVSSTVQDGRLVNELPVSPPINSQGTPADFGLVDGNVYKITIFQAERQRDGSSFQLTLAGFEATPSECTAICGDGVLSFGEECDDGVNDGGYGECGAGCVLGPFCGDGVQQTEFGESCDIGPGSDATCSGCRKLEIN